MIRPSQLLTLALALMPGVATALDFTTFRLDNGMEIHVIEDHRAPVVEHMVWYRIGAADEPPGKSGIAHFLEHLLFKGTETLAPGAFSATVAENGGTDNAFTSWDYTAYFQRVAADRLDLMMQMEADRMRNLKMSEDDVTTERAVILEERSLRIDSDPGALFEEQRAAAQYLNHPYGRPIIGWRHEMEALTREDALSFYRRYYAPNNAVLVVAGDVDPAEVLKMAQAHYGPLEPSPDIPDRVRPAEPPQLAERRLVYTDARIAQPYITRSYLAPERDPGDQRAAARLELLSAVLGGNASTSVLARKLQFDSTVAIYAGAYYDGTSIDDTTFGLVMVPAPGVAMDAAEAALDAAVDAFLQEGIDPGQFARIKMQLRASDIYARDNIEGLARSVGAQIASGLTPEDIQAWPELMQQVTAEEVMQAAAEILDRKKAVTGWAQPAAQVEAGQ